MLSITTSRPLGVVSLVVWPPDLKIVEMLRLIFGIIAYGNSVVLFHKNDKVSQCAKAFCQLIELPTGLLNFLSFKQIYGDEEVELPLRFGQPCAIHVRGDDAVRIAFHIALPELDVTMLKWFTEPKSVFIPVK